jgi:hypothetical protein
MMELFTLFGSRLKFKKRLIIHHVVQAEYEVPLLKLSKSIHGLILLNAA